MQSFVALPPCFPTIPYGPEIYPGYSYRHATISFWASRGRRSTQRWVALRLRIAATAGLVMAIGRHVKLDPPREGEEVEMGLNENHVVSRAEVPRGMRCERRTRSRRCCG